MKTIILLIILLTPFELIYKINYHPGDIYKYWFLPYLAEQESNHHQFAYNTNSTASGKWQITTTKNGGLQYWNDFHPKEQYLPADLFNCEISRKIASWIIGQNLKIFNGNKILAVNAYNMGVGNTRKNMIYYKYCVNILGATIVQNYLKDFILIRKSTNKKVLYVQSRDN